MVTHQKISPNFYIHEFVPMHIYNMYGENSKWFIRPEVIKIAEFYRRYFNAPVTINNWFWGGKLQERGFREPHSTTGSKYSQHKLGAAFDCNIRGINADDVRKEILDNQFCFMQVGVTTVEHGHYSPTWVHTDIRQTDMDEILIVKPAGVTMIGSVQLLELTEKYYRWNNGEYEDIDIHLF